MSVLRAKRPGGGVPARPQSYYLDAGHEYVRRFGEDQLVAAAFNPGSAKRAGRPDLLARYRSGRENGEPWPSLNSLKKAFDGSFNAFRAALGLSPNTTGPARGRRAAGDAEPIWNVREVRQVIPDSTVADLRRQLQKAERRADRLAVKLDTAKADVQVVEDNQQIDQLRQRLADESARRREAARGLANAVRREERARAREVALREASHGDAALLREVDRLTGRLVEAETRVRELETGSPLSQKPKTVVRTVREADPVVLRRLERQEEALGVARDERQRAEAARDELAQRLADIRKDAITAALKDQRVRTAAARVLEVEAQVAELTQILVGARRMPTQEELQALRTNGPSGQAVFKAAVLHVARAGGGGARKAALWEVIAAARNWIDRL